MKPTARHYRSYPFSKATSVVLAATICAFAMSACNVRPPARQNTGSPPDALDCYRGVTSVPDTGTGLANFKQIHGGFSYWGAYSEKIQQAGIPSLPLGMTGWTLPEDKKPDWSFTRADGTVARNLACWNSPYKDHIVERMVELVKSQPVDGFILDAFWWGAAGHDRDDWCCCNYCKSDYQRKFPGEMPLALDWETMEPELIQQCIEWRRDSLEEVYTKICARVKAVRQDVVINIHGGPSWHLDAGNLFSRISCQRLSDLAYFENYRDEIFWSAFLRGISQKPVALHTPHSQDAFEAQDPLAGYSSDYWDATVSGMMAHGCRPVTYLRWQPNGGLRKSYIDLIEPIYRAVEEREPYVKDHRPIRYAAIVYSETSQTYYRRNDPERSILPHLEGLFETLQKLHIPVEFIEAGMDLNLVALKKFRIVILPNTAILTDPQVEALTDYVRQGGSLLATYETGLYDERGLQQSDFALSEVLGLHFGKQHNDKWTEETANGEAGAYLAPKGDFLADLQAALAPDQNHTLHMPGPFIEVRPTGGESRATLAPVGPRSLGEFIQARATQTDFPAVHVNRFGRGKAAYLSNPLYKMIKIPLVTNANTYPKKQHLQWPFARSEGWVLEVTRELLEELAPNPPIRVVGPHHLECTFYEQPEEDRIVVHLLNGAVRQLGKTYPIGSATIKIRKDLADGRVPFLVWPQQANLRAEEIGDTLEVRIPETEVHQIVIFERVRTD
jgi:hypothetical protein